MKSKGFVRLFVLLFLAFSCQEESCEKTQRNAILSSNTYYSKAYQAELYRLIKESAEVDYYFEMREQIFGQDYLVVSAYGDAFCGKLCLVISEEDVAQITIDPSKGYQGAQLIGLRYSQNNSSYGWSSLQYDSIEYVVN